MKPKTALSGYNEHQRWLKAHAESEQAIRQNNLAQEYLINLKAVSRKGRKK